MSRRRSIESDIFIVSPMKLIFAGSNSETKYFAATDGDSEIQPGDQRATDELCSSSEEMNTSIDSDTFVITPMKLSSNLSESTVKSDTENIVDQPQLVNNDEGSTIQSVYQKVNKNLQKQQQPMLRKRRQIRARIQASSTMAPTRLTFNESVVNSEADNLDSDPHSGNENLVDQSQFLASDGVSTIEPVHQNVTIRRRCHHQKPRRSTFEPVYQNIAAFNSIEAVGDQPVWWRFDDRAYISEHNGSTETQEKSPS